MNNLTNYHSHCLYCDGVVSEEEFNKLKSLGAVGEAFGCYFNKDSKVVSENTSIGININEARKINRLYC